MMAWLWLVFSLLAIVFSQIQMPFWVLLVLDLCLICDFVYCIEAYIWNQRLDAVTGIRLNTRDLWIQTSGERWLKVKPLPGAIVTPFLIGVMVEGDLGKRYRVNIFPDSADAESRRKIRMLLRLNSLRE